MIRPERSVTLFFALVLVGATTVREQIALPGHLLLSKNIALARSTVAISAYPTRLAATDRFPALVLQQVAVANIAVYLPRVLPKSAPAYARVSAVPGIHRLELTFTPACDPDVHACHFATLLSATTIEPPADAVPITYAGVAMLYHKPVCGAYCGDGGLYFQLGGSRHAIEARGQLGVLETIYDSEARAE